MLTTAAGLTERVILIDAKGLVECALDIAAQSVLLACVISMLAQGLGEYAVTRYKRDNAI